MTPEERKTFIKRYDSLLQQVQMGCFSIERQVDEAYRHRPSVLAAHAMLGLFAGEIHGAVAMAEIYLKEELWRYDPSRIGHDLQNFSNLCYCVNHSPLREAMERIAIRLSAFFPIEHQMDDLENLEMELYERLQRLNTNGTIPGTYFECFHDAIIELTEVLKEIYTRQNPNYQKGQQLTSALPQEIDIFGFSENDDTVLLQEANTLAGFRSLYDNMRQVGCWPIVTAQLLLLCCEMEKAITYLQDDSEIAPTTLEEVNEQLYDGWLNELNATLDELEESFRHIQQVPEDEDIAAVIEQSLFPLCPHRVASTAIIMPTHAPTLYIIDCYRRLAAEFAIEIRNRKPISSHGE